ncbi:hypothetical protein BUALT_Bualt02G0028900 [Buddleja alternifolia]|uniref:Uncharacterized protein n=1 Tax=Buddleja alternifolia TaxID=168488 RepID=A0AAV6XYK2_9LAMI|nr:hypothetical protein BUALT_Bualt02G0028900 [Buddleja alternifolia]
MNYEWFEAMAKRVPKRVWLGFQMSMGLMVGWKSHIVQVLHSLNCVSVLLSLKRGNSNLSLERGKKNGLELLEMAFASWVLYEACGDEGIYACGGYDCGFVDANGPRGSDDRANNVEY